ncbi:flagellar basal body P-ring formation chaperone FlgA [Tropicimonas sp. IMCC34043]|uniref:flagellar basal body P-ring formation chaperone FlgA n=1 Tax=Tropicimonas sp. IMCC34043 TaxID=2248760 RepID=UPI000E288781|nr:flagellar basal body P-ring formation chaperone FlgA [Tropicimonas sp. IMCC34043]
MTARRSVLVAALMATVSGAAAADTLVARATIRSRAILGPEDVAFSAEASPGALTDPAEAIGMEARVVIYAGRPIRAEDLQQPALIERNQIVSLVYLRGGLSILTDGRSLDRAAIGETVRVINLASHTTVTGTVDPDGQVIVGLSGAFASNMEW